MPSAPWGFASSFVIFQRSHSLFFLQSHSLFFLLSHSTFSCSLILVFLLSHSASLLLSHSLFISPCSGPRAKGPRAQFVIEWQPLIGDLHSHSLFFFSVSVIVYFLVFWSQRQAALGPVGHWMAAAHWELAFCCIGPRALDNKQQENGKTKGQTTQQSQKHLGTGRTSSQELGQHPGGGNRKTRESQN